MRGRGEWEGKEKRGGKMGDVVSKKNGDGMDGREEKEKKRVAEVA